jgi:hypothetical protein
MFRIEKPNLQPVRKSHKTTPAVWENAAMNDFDHRNQSATSRAAQLAAERDGNLPVWVRAPKHGHEFYSGCSRPKLYEWAAKGFIRSVSIREPGRIKGVRLFHLASIFAFFEQCETSAQNYAAREPTCLPAALKTGD